MEKMLLGDDIYEVQEIVGIKKSEGRLLYRVRWQGYGSQSDTWEPEENLMLCRDLIEDFVAQRSTHKNHGPKLANNFKGENEPSDGHGRPATQDSESESFWQQDMYSRVKGRAAKRHQSRQTEGSSHRSKRGRPRVLQTLSQSYDNARKLPSHKGAPRKKVITTQERNVERKLHNREQNLEKTSLQPLTPNNSTSAIPFDVKTEIKEPKKTESLSPEFPISKYEYLKPKTDSSLVLPKDSGLKQNKLESNLKTNVHQVEDELRQTLETELALVAEGGDTRVLLSILSSSDWKRRSFELLSIAEPEQLKILLKSGADVNCRDPSLGATLLMAASKWGKTEIVHLLLKFGARKDATDNNGRTALMLACSSGHKGVTQELLWAGCNFGATDIHGFSATPIIEADNFIAHIALVSASFKEQVSCTLSTEVNMVQALFPLQCLSVCEGPCFTITFRHQTQVAKPGIGYLLFIASASISKESVKCSLYGSSPVQSVELNGCKQNSLTEDGENFVFPFSPLNDGQNILTILTQDLPKSEVKMLVRAYKSELNHRKPEISSENYGDTS